MHRTEQFSEIQKNDGLCAVKRGAPAHPAAAPGDRDTPAPVGGGYSIPARSSIGRPPTLLLLLGQGCSVAQAQ